MEWKREKFHPAKTNVHNLDDQLPSKENGKFHFLNFRKTVE